jgi:hypothetical protein
VSRIVETDFIEDAVNALQFGTGGRYTHAILNPPYKKSKGPGSISFG